MARQGREQSRAGDQSDAGREQLPEVPINLLHVLRLDAEQAKEIPWLDPIGQTVIGSNWRNTGVENGAQVYNMRDYLNQQLAFTWYGVTNSDTQTTFGNHMRSNYDHNTAMITGLYANGMPYWHMGSGGVAHIVAVYGFTTDSTSVWAGNVTNIYYVDANPPVSGHYDGNTSTYAPYYNALTASQMWAMVTQFSFTNNWQIW